MPDLTHSRIEERTHRLIASIYPPIGVFDDLTDDPDELRVAFLLESATNDRFLLLSKRLDLLPNKEIAAGPTASIVMAAFLHANEQGGRFNDERLGAWYASFNVETAIRETLYHSDRRLRLSEGAFPSKIQMRELIADIDLTMVDLRGCQNDYPDIYDPTDYKSAQKFGNSLRWPQHSDTTESGIVYDSVRDRDGTNICIFWPSLVPLPVLQGDHYEYDWDKDGNSTVLKLTNVDL